MSEKPALQVVDLPHFRDSSLLDLAFTHASFRFENQKKIANDNERLEFLGDAVLQLFLSEVLYQKFPEHPEGDLSKWRASLVNEHYLAQLALGLSLDQKLKMGKGESASGGAKKPRLLSSVLEAVIGAYYLDSGKDKAWAWLSGLFEAAISNPDADHFASFDFKTDLQEKVQKLFKKTPTYEVLKDEGPDHDKVFFVAVHVGDKIIGGGSGKSKKLAEQKAAENALSKLKES